MPGTEPFEALAAHLEYPIYIVTTIAGGERAGCLIGFATQCSIDPTRFLACISDKNRTCRIAARAEALAVHLVPDDGQELVELFGGETSDDVDKFAHAAWSSGPLGLPILDGCPEWFAGRVIERIPLGDHIGHLVEPFAGRGDDGTQYSAPKARQIDPGHRA